MVYSNGKLFYRTPCACCGRKIVFGFAVIVDRLFLCLDCADVKNGEI